MLNMKRVYYLLCWAGWFSGCNSRLHEWAQWRFLDAKHPGEWVTLEELERKYRNEEPTL
jgi:hypothetical protein